MSVTSKSSASTSSVSIAATAAAGGITVTQPAETAATSYYKIYSGVEVTFGWNFTSVSSYFDSLTVQAYCSDNSNTYPIATIAGTATEAVWAPYNYSVSAAANGQPALVMETYRLQIYGDKGLSAAASPGIMSPNDDTEFALYIPQSYTPLASGWTCVSCKNNGAFGLASSPLMVALFATLTACFLSGWSLFHRSSR